ncbi:hypothetical protein [Streptomyces sp. NBC_00385]|uniref:hypothetical protein n=1 Tax=Streptomyces sp. NBC_00385 TaxID=2975733 RepID=UPI002DD873A0|nr:hypothetical protein [Streptomyces sp. NBC_00385]WRZ04959.1 hypothetical protein OG959_17125 [Streptomyces sp. NBC_00385]
MPWITLALEQFLQWKLGVLGSVGFTLTAVGIKLGNDKCLTMGCVTLALLICPLPDGQ